MNLQLVPFVDFQAFKSKQTSLPPSRLLICGSALWQCASHANDSRTVQAFRIKGPLLACGLTFQPIRLNYRNFASILHLIRISSRFETLHAASLQISRTI